MAYDKIIAVHHRLDHCINYALNEHKTVSGSARLIAGINCDPETALEDMKATKRRWDKRGGVVGYHLIHSYKPGETTPEEAQAAGVEFAQRLLGERYEAIVCTHIDHEHLHCHIVFNSVSFVDGKKYRNDFKAYFGDIRETSNEVSRERSLSVIEHPENKGRHYAEWNAEKQGKPTGKALVRQDVDAAIESAFTYKSFWAALEKMGYGLEHAHGRKHPAVRPPGSDRYFRLDGLGEGYTEDAIRQRIASHRETPRKETVEFKPLRVPRRYTVKRRFKRPGKLKGFRALYVHYLFLLGAVRPQKRPVPFPVRQEVFKLERYIRQARFLREHEISTPLELSMLENSVQVDIDSYITERKALYREKRQGLPVEPEIQRINEKLRPLRRKLRLCRQIAEDIPKIRERLSSACAAQNQNIQKENQKQKEGEKIWTQAEK